MAVSMSPRWARSLIDALLARPWVSIGLVLSVVAGLSVFAGRWFVADNSAKVWLLEDDPAMVAYNQFLDRFGNDEVVIIAIARDDGIYDAKLLQGVRAASKRIEEHDKIRRVDSVAVSTFMEGDAIEIRVQPLIPSVDDEPQITAALAAEAQHRVESDPLLRATLVSPDRQVTLIVAQFASLDKVTGQRPIILDELRAIVAEEIPLERASVHFGGVGVIYDAINRAVLSDTRLFIVLSYVLILFGLWLLFRRVVWVLLALGIIVAATLVTAGLFGALHRKLNMVTSIVPTLILSVGVLDLVHLIAAREEADEENLRDTLAGVAVPCVFNTVTDVIGFLALVSAPMAGVRDFGLLSAAGLLFLLMASLVFAVPALAADARRRPRRMRPERTWTVRLVLKLGGFAARHKTAVIAGGVLLIGVGGLGTSFIVVDTYNLEFLAADHPARTSHEFIEQRYGFYIPLEMTVDSGAAGHMKEPAVLSKLDAAERAIEAHPRVQHVTGLPEVVTRLNEVVMDGDPAERRIPDSRRAVAQQLLLYESDGGDALERMTGPEDRIGRITGRIEMTSARGVQELISDVERIARRELGDEISLKVSGYLSLYVRIVDTIAAAQVRSFALAFVLVALVLMVLLRSVKLGAIALVPNLLPALLTLGIMGFLGIRLDVGTVLVASLALGISVNDTSHLMCRFAGEIARTPFDAGAALGRSLAVTGRAIFASSIILMAGFGVLGFASTNSIRMFGILSAATVAFALVADLLLTPALLALIYDADDVSPRRAGSPSTLPK